MTVPRMDAGWFVVQTKPRQEDTALANLQQQGYTAWLPRLAVPRRRREQWVTVSEPLFPGYLFVQLTPGKDDPAPIRSTLGARGLVRFGQYTPQVDDTLVAFFREHEHAQQADAPASTPFQPGNPVTILKGPFAGLHAVYEMSAASDRALLLISILGRETRLQCHINDICPA